MPMSPSVTRSPALDADGVRNEPPAPYLPRYDANSDFGSVAKVPSSSAFGGSGPARRGLVPVTRFATRSSSSHVTFAPVAIASLTELDQTSAPPAVSICSRRPYAARSSRISWSAASFASKKASSASVGAMPASLFARDARSMRMRCCSRKDLTEDPASVSVLVGSARLAPSECLFAAAPFSRVSTTAVSIRTTTSLKLATCSRRSSCFTSMTRMASALRAISSSAVWMRIERACTRP